MREVSVQADVSLVGDRGRRSARLAVRAALVSAVMVVALVCVPAALASSPPLLYWTNFGSDTIGEANLDGGAANQSLITGADQPEGVVANLDPRSRKLVEVSAGREAES
jgi:hypothetical protein